jgi:hypothetical protein
MEPAAPDPDDTVEEETRVRGESAWRSGPPSSDSSPGGARERATEARGEAAWVFGDARHDPGPDPNPQPTSDPPQVPERETKIRGEAAWLGDGRLNSRTTNDPSQSPGSPSTLLGLLMSRQARATG